MAGIGLKLDPTAEGTGTELNIADGTTFALVGEPDFSPPDLEPQWATSSDTEGSLLAATKHQNRTIVIPLRVYGGTATGLDTQLAKLQQKTGKIVREGGTLQLTVPSGKTVVFDLIDAQVKPTINQRYVTNATTDVELRCTAKPYGRLPVQTFASHSETTLPVLTFTETGVQGDVPGLGDLTITEAQGADQFFVMSAIQSRYYDSATTAGLFYQAEGLTPQGASTLVAGPTGASGSGSNIVRSGVLTTSYQAVMSTQASGGGAHFSHVGDYNVWARIQTPAANNGAVSVALEWSVGDYLTPTRNDPVVLPIDAWEGTWRLVKLGQVHVGQVRPGTAQRWEGRILAKTTGAGASVDKVDIDYLLLMPATEGYAEARAVQPFQQITVFSARDEFNQTAGSLTGKTAAVGGTWAGAGDPDFSVTGAPTFVAQRTTVLDGTARYATLPVSLTNTIAQVDASWNTNQATTTGVIGRYVDTNNWLICAIDNTSTGTLAYLRIKQNVAGTLKTLASCPLPAMLANTVYTVRLAVFANGAAFGWFYDAATTTPGTPLVVAYSSDAATGGALATGAPGIYDSNGTAGAVTRTYDNFLAAVPVPDAAVFASQHIEIRDDRAIRADAGGVTWKRVSDYQGFYLLVPPAGQEGRSLRVAVKACRFDPDTGPDPAIDDISAQLTVTPRVLFVPE